MGLIMDKNFNLEDIIEKKSFSKIEYFISKYEKEIKNVDNKEKSIKLNKKEKNKIYMYLIFPFSILNIIIINSTNSTLMTILFFLLSMLCQMFVSISVINVKENINKSNYEEDIKFFKNQSFLLEDTGYFKNKKVLREIRSNYLLLLEKEKYIFENYLLKSNIENKELFLKNLFTSQLNKKTNHKYIFDNQKKVINFIKENFKSAIEGYLSNNQTVQKELIPKATALITLELSARFLIDYFENTYFRSRKTEWDSEENFRRLENQMKFYSDMKSQLKL